MKTKFIKSVLIAIIFSLNLSNVNAQDANAILQKMDNVMFSSKDMSAKTKIILIDKSGKEDVRDATMQQKGKDSRLFRFTSPASQAGIAVLSLPADVMYLYLPAFGKERRISPSVKNQSFAETDFSYDDMESKPFAEKYTPKLTNSEGNVFVLELTPKAKSSYSKIIVKINKTNYYPEFMEFYNARNEMSKTAKYTFVKIGNYWNAQEVEMKDLKKNHTTKMQMSDVKYDSNLSDDDFSVRKLKQ